MSAAWAVLYDVSRDGIRVVPTLPFLIVWIAGDAGAAISLRNRVAGRGAPQLLWIWLLSWNLGWGFAVTTQLARYLHNATALNNGNISIAEGVVKRFHRQDDSKKGDFEQFTVAGHTFQYSSAVLGNGGMHSSADFNPPLHDGLRVRVHYRDDSILKLQAQR